MIRKQQPYGLLKTAGHLVSMPRHNVNSEEFSEGRAFEFTPTHQTDTLADSRIQPRGGYSHTLPIRVCAAQRGRDFEAPGLERGIHFRGVF